MTAAGSGLWFKFEALAFDAPAITPWRKPRPQEVDNIAVGPVTEADLRDDLLQPAEAPF
jgi:hypothetical protein